MDKPRIRLELHMVNEATGKVYRKAVRLDNDEAVDREEWTPAPIKPPSLVGSASFDETVQIMRRREFRRDSIVAQAESLASELCDHLEDVEGWHGANRQEKAKAASTHDHPQHDGEQRD